MKKQNTATRSDAKAETFIEEEIARLAVANGAASAANKYSGRHRDAYRVLLAVKAAVRKALDLGIIPDDEAPNTLAYAERKEEERIKLKEALDREEAELKAKLEELEADEELPV